MSVASLDLDLEVFQGPFDLLLTLVLNEEVDLLEVDLADVVLAYVEHLERAGELDLEAATEFLVLIAALLELKSRLMLPTSEDEEGLDLVPSEAADELLARMVEYHRYRGAAAHLRERLEAEHGHRYRSAPLPPELRRVALETAEPAYDPERLAEALGDLLRIPPPLDLRHLRRPTVSVEQRLRHLRDLLGNAPELLLRRRGSRFRPPDRGGHALRPARAVQGGRGQVGAVGAVRPDHRHGGCRVNDLARIVEALLFLSPEPVSVERLADASEVSESEVVEALARLREHYAEGYRGVVLREVAGGFTLATDPVAERAARRLLARPRTPPLTQAQAECLAIVAYLQPVSRPELGRIRGVGSESAVGTLLERGLVEESGPLAVRRGALPDHRAVREALRPRRPRHAARPREVRPDPRGAGRAARAAAAGRRAARAGLSSPPAPRRAGRLQRLGGEVVSRPVTCVAPVCDPSRLPPTRRTLT